jgi:hypothetical protein
MGRVEGKGKKRKGRRGRKGRKEEGRDDLVPNKIPGSAIGRI